MGWEEPDNLQLEHHVEHSLGTVGLQQLDNVRMLQHVTYCGLALQICEKEERWHGDEY